MLEPAAALGCEAGDATASPTTLSDLLSLALILHAVVALPFGIAATTRPDILLGTPTISGSDSSEPQLWLQVVGVICALQGVFALLTALCSRHRMTLLLFTRYLFAQTALVAAVTSWHEHLVAGGSPGLVRGVVATEDALAATAAALTSAKGACVLVLRALLAVRDAIIVSVKSAIPRKTLEAVTSWASSFASRFDGSGSSSRTSSRPGGSSAGSSTWPPHTVPAALHSASVAANVAMALLAVQFLLQLLLLAAHVMPPSGAPHSHHHARKAGHELRHSNSNNVATMTMTTSVAEVEIMEEVAEVAVVDAPPATVPASPAPPSSTTDTTSADGDDGAQPLLPHEMAAA